MNVNFVRKADDWVRIENVLMSVADKTGLDTLISELIKINRNIHFYSTGGTYQTIADILGSGGAKCHLSQVSDYTGQPETQGGLVKTLDFKIYLGLLTETYNEFHQADLKRTSASILDMVVVNLYPFEATVADPGVSIEEGRANIDIGGVCMIRASAKNYLRVTSVVDPTDYPFLLEMLDSQRGKLNLKQRFEFACKAFTHTARYDEAISRFLSKQDSEQVSASYDLNGNG